MLFLHGALLSILCEPHARGWGSFLKRCCCALCTNKRKEYHFNGETVSDPVLPDGHQSSYLNRIFAPKKLRIMLTPTAQHFANRLVMLVSMITHSSVVKTHSTPLMISD